MNKENIKQNSIVIYTSRRGVDLEVRMQHESVWLSLLQIAHLFDTDKSGISRHIHNIYKTGELSQNATVAKIATVQKEGGRAIERAIEHYNLDMIISIGYRVNSKQATRFRVWATSVLKKYLVEGYAINEQRLRQAQEKFEALRSTIDFLNAKITSKNLKGQEKEIFSLLSDYSKTLSVLKGYDSHTLEQPKGVRSRFVLKYEQARTILDRVRQELILKHEAMELFASERGEVFQGIIGNLYQTFGGKELYATIEEKAAHLLYFTIKDHPFSDGNKRSAAFLFVYFLDRNKYLHKKSGEKKINDNALAALALLVAESDPKEKDLMVKLIINLIAE